MRSRSRFLVIPVFLLVLAGTAWGEVDRIPVSDLESGIRLLDRTDDRMSFRITVGELVTMDVVTKEGTFSRLMLPGFYSSREIGEPCLPMVNRLFEIPFGAEVSVDVVSFETHEISLAEAGVMHPLMPAQPSVAKNEDPEVLPFHYNWATYHADQEYGLELAQAVDTGQLRAVRIGRLEVAPVTYNPVAGTLTVLDNIEVEVTFTGADHEAEALLKARTYSPFFEPIYEKIEGYRGLHDNYPDLWDGAVTYVMVSDPMFEAQLQPFINWKIEQGFDVIEAYTDNPQVGTTTTSIRTYLHDLYNNPPPGSAPPTFVLFVGDVSEIPAFNLAGYSDLHYCDTTGDDVPEMYYGRFSARTTAELQPQIDKTIEYEMYQMPDPDFLGEVVMIAGMDSSHGSTHANGQINYGTIHYFNLAHGITSHTYLYPGSGSSDAQIVQDVSNGCAVVNYTAHGNATSWGDPTFTMTDVANLQNAHESCQAIGNCCSTSSFEVGTCFAEQWLRVENGGIGYIGGSDGTYWDEDYHWGVGYGPVIGSGATYEQTELGMYDGWFHDHGEAIGLWYYCQDAEIFCGNLAVQESGSGLTDYYWEIYNLMGDPSLSVYLGVPDANNVSLPMNILPTDTEVIVSAAPESYVGLSKDGVLLGSGLIGSSGTAAIPISGQGYEGDVRVTVTCQNRIPYRLDVPVMSLDGPYLVFDHNDIVDTAGDNDGVVDVGETIEIVTYLENLGNDPSTNTVGVLSANRSVVITDDTETWGTIASEEIKPCDDSFDLVVVPGTPDQTLCEFTLNLTCVETTFVREFSFICEAPIVGFVEMFVDDSVGGDGDGTAEPGETVDLSFRLNNSGHEDARSVEGVLWSSSTLMVINDNFGSIATVPVGTETDLGGFNVTIDPTCPDMTTINLHLNITGEFGYAVALAMPLPISPFFDEFEQFLGWTVTGTASTGAWEQADPEGTTYNGQDCQTEDDHSPTPGRRCMVTGPMAGDGAGTYDVDNGNTILTSPLFDLGEEISATVEYWRWYTNDLGGAPGEDWWTVQVTNDDGASWVDLERTQGSANYWQKMSFLIEDYVELSTQVRIRFIAEDVGAGSLVEAAVDDFLLFGVKEDVTEIAEDGPFAAAAVFGLAQNRPNPFNPQTEILYRLSSGSAVPTTLKIYDTTGRLVRTLVDEDLGTGEYRSFWDGTDDNGHPVSSGVFFYRLVSGAEGQTKKMILLK
ncbi:MAG: hypothetical protein KAW17_03365 [Candidatus Eisenbacteria sp.]|nr:hypothetical protein [Candidatus Eisenbacteria bacterium]